MPSLLDINVDALFEQHSVAEINQIYKNLQIDVELKKEELRTMVGERYRDLLKAADTIGDMKSTGSQVTANIDDITATCRSLNEQQLIGFKSSATNRIQHPDRALQHIQGVAMQIKLLTQLPEMICANLDAENYLIASQLFIFSRHINTGLQLDTNRLAIRLFPVARHLWANINPYLLTIRKSCLATLQKHTVQPKAAAMCLASLVLLDNGNMDNLLHSLMQTREKAFLAALTDDHVGRKVRDKILGSLKVLIDTVDLVHECFVRELVANELDVLNANDAPPTIGLLNIDDAMDRRLPDIIRKFRPHLQIIPLNTEYLKKSMGDWLHSTSHAWKRHIESVIAGIVSVKTIHRIKKEAYAIQKPSDWLTILGSLYLPTSLDLYEFCYQPLISDRVKQIIEQSWSIAIQQMHEQVAALVSKENAMNRDFKHPNRWMLHSSDLPLSLKQALTDDKQSHRLLMKSKGFSSSIVSICDSLDAHMKTIYDDLAVYLSIDGATTTTTTPPADTHQHSDDHARVVSFLQATSREGIVTVIQNTTTTTSRDPVVHSQSTLVCLATLLRGLCELCPHLKRCLLPLDRATLSDGAAPLQPPTSDAWDHVRGLLEAESFRFWLQWIDAFAATYATHFAGAPSIDLQWLMADMLTWETISIEEQDEQDRAIQSTIRVPAHVSVSLQHFFHNVSRGLTQIAAYTLPPNVTRALADKLTQHLHSVYAARRAHAFVQSSQNASLQCYFDVKFVQMVLVARDRKTEWDQWQQLSAAFKAHVDPFDFELFHKHLTANVKKSVQRMQHKMAILLANADHLGSILATSKATAGGAQDKEPNVLTLSTKSNETSRWFSMLPVMAPTTTTTATTATQRKSTTAPTAELSSSNQQASATAKVPPPQHSQHSTLGASAQQSKAPASNDSSTQNLANVKSGAAALFGEWFR